MTAALGERTEHPGEERLNTENTQDKPVTVEGPPARENVKHVTPADVMYTHQVGDGPARGWVHTHGLAALGLPELEIRGVPLLLGRQAAALLEGIADYMLNEAGKPVLAGHKMRLNESMFQLIEGAPNDAAGYDSGHYGAGVTRLTLVDMEGAHSCQLCEAEGPLDAEGNRPTQDDLAVATAKLAELYERERKRLGEASADEKLRLLRQEPHASVPCLICIDEELGYVWGNMVVVCAAEAKFLGRNEDVACTIAEAQQRIGT
jgi:hypothetical protein